MKLFIVLFLFSSQAFAWDITFERTNHMGFQKVDILRQEKGEYFFADRSIGKSLPANVLSAWKTLEKGPAKSTNTAECAAGQFQFTKKDNKKEQHRAGCMHGPAYADFIQSLEQVRDYAKSI